MAMNIEADGSKGNNRQGFGHRHIQVILMFLVAATAYIIRIGMSVAILAMATSTGGNNTGYQTFDWDKKTQDIILSSFFWGYAMMPIFAGVLGIHFGPWILICITLGTNALACIIIPSLVPYGGWIVLCAIRMLTGISQGLVFPSIHTLLAKWAPLKERSRLFNFVFAGVSIGSTSSQSIAGLLANSTGWPSIFYVFGLCAIVIGLLWGIFGSNSPADHKLISLKERNYIETSLNTTSEVKSKTRKTPFKEIAKSVPVWALIMTQVGWNYGYLILILETPSYMTNVLGISLKMAGMLSGISHIPSLGVGIIASIINDALLSKHICSNTTLRKFWTTFALFGQVVPLVILAFLSPEYTITGVTLLIIITGINGAVPSAFMINSMELSPNFAGVLIGTATTLSNFVGVTGPILSGLILNEQEHDHTRWRIIFLITALIYFASNIIFICFGTSEVQPWNHPERDYLPVDTFDVQNNNKAQNNNDGEQQERL